MTQVIYAASLIDGYCPTEAIRARPRTHPFPLPMSLASVRRPPRPIALSWFVLSAGALALAACGGGDTAAPCTVGAVSVGAPNTNVAVGQSVQATANFSVLNCSPPPSTVWSSENNALATVSATGLITGVAVGGPVSIRATVNGNTGTTAVTVVPVPVASILMTPTTATAFVGQTTTLAATPRDAAGNALTGRTVTWTSSNPAVATVAGGVVTGVTVGGPVSITATVGTITATAAVTVALVPVASVTITPGPVTMVPLRSKFFTATARDGAGNVLSGRTVTWTSTNAVVAGVNAGLVSTFATGQSTITASISGMQGTAVLTVIPQIDLGYGVANDSIGSTYVVAESFTNPGDSITSRRTGLGTYEVRVLGMAASNSAPRFVYVNSRRATAHCHPAGSPTAQVNGAILVAVVCGSVTTGAAVDASFSFVVLGKDAFAGRTGFLVTPTAALPAELFSPSSPFTAASRGTDANIQVEGNANAGQYAVLFTALARTGTDVAESHFAQSWGTSPGTWCASGGWDFGIFDATVRCYNEAFVQSNERFGTLVLDRGRTGKRFALAWVNDPITPAAPDATYAYSTGGAITLTRVSAGVSDVRFAGLAGAAGVPVLPIVSSYGGTASNGHCTPTAVTRVGADLVVRVQCVTAGTGAPRDQIFTIAIIE